ITVDEGSIKQIGENAYTGVARYENVSQVEKAVQNILKASEKQLEKAKTPKDIITAVVSMEKDLISVHPFLDGNGRTIRLLGDYVLSRHHLPPSLYPNESDLTMSLNKAVEFRTQGMKDYLKEHQKQMIEIQKSRFLEQQFSIGSDRT
ncbi:MAG: Fic family protein, partial [Oligoflexia bacterium]|nr:Fic family protein [Oligoflexia bacterium]